VIGLDLLGAGEGFATQAIVLRVRRIDAERMRAKLTESTPTWAPAIVSAVKLADNAPRLALDVALPVVKQQLAAFGVEADVFAGPAAATGLVPAVRDPIASREAIIAGVVLGALLALSGRWAYTRITEKGTTP